jgi:hypothetical protein
MCFKRALPSSQIDLYCLSAEISDNNVTVESYMCTVCNSQTIENSECFGVIFFKIYPEMTSQYFFEKIWFWLII